MRCSLAVISAAVALATLAVGCTGAPATTSPPRPDITGGATDGTPSRSASASATGSATETTSGSGGPSASATVPTPVQCAAKLVEAMSLTQRAGQLVMVGITDAGPSELRVLRTQQIGSVILMGTRTSGVSGVKKVTARLAWKGQKVPLLVAADQEGGTVQRLKGPGFDTIPSARVQATWSSATLQSRATRWGRQLAAAGVHWTLAPVADVVPAGMINRNAPIGALRRGYSSDPATVTGKVTAFVRGMRAAGVATSAKHFPGIGRVVGNTDFTAGVKDTVTTRDDPYLQPFEGAIDARVPSVMVSTVTYTKIDPAQPAVFSRSVIGLIRDVGFKGVVISDDLGAARSMAAVPAGQRAIRFVKAGGDVAITVAPALADEFVNGIVAAAKTSPSVRTQVQRAAQRVLTMKIEQGLLPCG